MSVWFTDLLEFLCINLVIVCFVLPCWLFYVISCYQVTKKWEYALSKEIPQDLNGVSIDHNEFSNSRITVSWFDYWKG